MSPRVLLFGVNCLSLLSNWGCPGGSLGLLLPVRLCSVTHNGYLIK